MEEKILGVNFNRLPVRHLFGQQEGVNVQALKIMFSNTSSSTLNTALYNLP